MQELFDLPDQYDSMLNKGIGITGNDKHFFIKGRLEMLLQFLPKEFKPKQILDFGCGTGSTSMELAELFPLAGIIGSDVSAPSIEYAKKYCKKENLRFVDFNELSGFENFDLVYLNCVIHHIPLQDRQAEMERLFSVLKPGGLIFIFENNPANPGTQLAMFTNPFDKGVVKVWPNDLKKMMIQAGLKIRNCGFIFYFPQWLSVFRPLEKHLIQLPLGGQYGVFANKPE
jgi:SAM-dependent methyltransferase